MNAPSDEYRKLNSTQELARVYPKLERECSTDKAMVTADTSLAVISATLGGLILIANQRDPEASNFDEAMDQGMKEAVGVGALLASGIFGASAYLRRTKIDRCRAYLKHLRSVRDKELWP